MNLHRSGPVARNFWTHVPNRHCIRLIPQDISTGVPALRSEGLIDEHDDGHIDEKRDTSVDSPSNNHSCKHHIKNTKSCAERHVRWTRRCGSTHSTISKNQPCRESQHGTLPHSASRHGNTACAVLLRRNSNVCYCFSVAFHFLDGWLFQAAVIYVVH